MTTTKRPVGRPVGTRSSAPKNPERVGRILRLYDEDQLSFAEIGRRIGISRMGASLLYKRWKSVLAA